MSAELKTTKLLSDLYYLVQKYASLKGMVRVLEDQITSVRKRLLEIDGKIGVVLTKIEESRLNAKKTKQT